MFLKAATTGRVAINYNHKALIRELKELKQNGVAVPNLNAKREKLEDFLLLNLNSDISYLKNKFGITDCVFKSHIDTAIWSSTDDEGNPLDKLNLKLSRSAKVCLDYDLVKFFYLACYQLRQGNFVEFESDINDLGFDLSNVAHDFWLTRNEHGTGFWDKNYVTFTTPLNNLSKKFNQVNLYVCEGEIRLLDSWSTPIPLPT